MNIKVKQQLSEYYLNDGVFECVHPDSFIESIVTDYMDFNGPNQYETPARFCAVCDAELEMDEYED